MKNNKRYKADYTKLYQKIILQIFLFLVAAIGFVVFLRWLLYGKLADFLVAIIEKVFGLTYDVAFSIYNIVIRNNMDIILITAIAVIFLVLCRFLLTRFSKYFDEINEGIDILIKGDAKEIQLSPEMGTMEKKLGILQQTLEKRELEAKLAEQRKNDLVMYLAHDIKTPLTSVIGYLSLLDEAPDMPIEQKAKYVSITLRKAYRLEQLIDEFFEITRYNIQTINLSKENIDLYYMLVQMVDEFYPQLAEKGKRITLVAKEDLTIYGDPDKLARVFNNILKNAMTYSVDKSEILISASSYENRVVIVFKSEGSISENRLAIIFEQFYRLDGARSSDKGGAGLGLAIAKKIIDLHGGKIYANSDGQYTSFTVELVAMPAFATKESQRR